MLWATGTVRSPFGLNDPRAGEVMSYFGGLESSQTGLAAVAVGLAGALTALAARCLPGYRWPAVPALVLSFVLILVVPDVRVIQNFAYLSFGYTGLWDFGLAAMLVSMAGGLLWALTALAQLTRGQSVPASLPDPWWGAAATYAAAALALPYPIVRIAWSLGVPLGVPAGYVVDMGMAERLGIFFVLGGLPVAGAILTVGLIRPWGEVFPRWIPVLRGRRVPIWFAVAPGVWAAALISQAGLRLAGGVRELGEITWDSWGLGLPGLFFLPWGLALAAAVYAYAVRRIRQDKDSAAIRRRPDDHGGSN